MTTSNNEEVKILTLRSSRAGVVFGDTPLRRLSRQPLLHSPRAWSICGATDCVSLRSNIKNNTLTKSVFYTNRCFYTAFSCQTFRSNIFGVATIKKINFTKTSLENVIGKNFLIQLSCWKPSHGQCCNTILLSLKSDYSVKWDLANTLPNSSLVFFPELYSINYWLLFGKTIPRMETSYIFTFLDWIPHLNI